MGTLPTTTTMYVEDETTNRNNSPPPPNETTANDDYNASMQKSSSMPHSIIITITTFGTESGTKPDKQSLDYETFKCHWIPNPSSKSRKGTPGKSKKLRNEILSCEHVPVFVSTCVATMENVIIQQQR